MVGVEAAAGTSAAPAGAVGPPGPSRARHARVAIVGAGFSGIAAAARLRRAGVDGVVVLERAGEVGGTWRDNRYPGAACDVASHVYELADLPNPRWGQRFARQPEIQQYLVDAAGRLGVRPLVRFGHEVLECRWDEDTARWQLDTTQGSLTADVVVAAPGPLSEPRLPDLPGLPEFAGEVVHTARWDPALELAGRRVAVIGTGASAIQVVPAIQPGAGHVTVFQRTPPWVVPRGDRPVPEALQELLAVLAPLREARRRATRLRHELYGAAFRHEALARLITRIGRRHLRRQVADPELRRQLTPDYLIGCKRVLLSDDYYPALQQPNVTFVPHPAARLTRRGVVGADGSEHEADVVVVATGFRVTEFPFADRVVGRDGRRLREAWTPSMHAHLGIGVPGFPNLFVVLGPHTGLGHSSVVLMAEAQVDHVVAAVEHLGRHDLASLEARPEAEARFLAELDHGMQGTVWVVGGCDSWYLDATGRNTTLWPGSVGSFRRRVRPFRARDYVARPAGQAATPTSTPASATISTTSARTSATASTSAVLPGRAERASGAVARQVHRLPAPVLGALGTGMPAVVDGQRLDPAVRALLARTHDRSPSLTEGSPAEARARYRRDTLALAAPGRPTPVGAVEHVTVPGPGGPLAARLYRPVAGDGGGGGGGHGDGDLRGAELPLLVWFHGGGYVLGDLDTHDEPCRLLCRHGRQLVLSVAYRLAPEHPFPAAVDDAVAAVRWAGEHAAALGADRVAVGGDSAGGNLAAVASHAVRDGGGPALAGQLLVYPVTDRTRRHRSFELFDGYLLSAADTDRFAEHYYGATPEGDADPRISPARAADLSRLPQALVVTAGYDVLRDEAEAYAQALADAGTEARLHREPGLPHGFLHLTPVSPVAAAAVTRLACWWRQVVAVPGTRHTGQERT